MKYIEKKAKNEPKTLKKYRETTENATYSGFGDTGQLLKIALLEEQGYLCGYCMKRISLQRDKRLKKPRIEVEHFQSQDEYPALDLDFTNMIGVCNGNVVDTSDVVIEHCDKSKKEHKLAQLSPHRKDIEQLIQFSSSGKIASKKENAAITDDLDIILNLNNQNLVKARREVIDIALQLLIKKQPKGTWTKRLIQKEIDLWNAKKNGKYRPFCNVVIWFWQQQKQRNRYAEK